jgi:hypothetical protein
MIKDNLDVDIEQFSSFIYQINVGDKVPFYIQDKELRVKRSNGDYQLEISDRVIVSKGTRTQMESASNKLKKLLSDDYIKNKYDINIKELKKYNYTIMAERGEVKRKIEELSKRTILPGKSCNWIKDFEIRE